eukprot:GGOE01001244.1.p2 GENE.GGOE01001244.1~~GGOE01001244.1.p2  ORF type:complete len:197 (+),score=28.22 GGOE01001244.1:38-628(+)
MHFAHAVPLFLLTVFFIWAELQFLHNELHMKAQFIFEGINEINENFSNSNSCVPIGNAPTAMLTWEDTVRRIAGKDLRRHRGPNCTYEFAQASNVYFGGSAMNKQDGVDGIAFTCEWHFAAGGCECCPQPVYSVQHGPIHVFPELAIATQYWAFGYGHWMMEAFPRLSELHSILVARPAVKLLVPDAPFVLPCLLC